MIKVGDRIPNANLRRLTDQGFEEINLSKRMKGKKIILFGIPGAFTGTCTIIHLPSFVKHADEFKAKGIDEILCVAVNDPFVMKALEAHTKAEGHVTLLSDWDAAFTQAIGLALDGSAFGLGIRSARYTMLIEDGIVKHMSVEEDPIACGTTHTNFILEML